MSTSKASKIASLLWLMAGGWDCVDLKDVAVKKSSKILRD